MDMKEYKSVCDLNLSINSFNYSLFGADILIKKCQYSQSCNSHLNPAPAPQQQSQVIVQTLTILDCTPRRNPHLQKRKASSHNRKALQESNLNIRSASGQPGWPVANYFQDMNTSQLQDYLLKRRYPTPEEIDALRSPVKPPAQSPREHGSPPPLHQDILDDTKPEQSQNNFDCGLFINQETNAFIKTASQDEPVITDYQVTFAQTPFQLELQKQELASQQVPPPIELKKEPEKLDELMQEEEQSQKDFANQLEQENFQFKQDPASQMYKLEIKPEVPAEQSQRITSLLEAAKENPEETVSFIQGRLYSAQEVVIMYEKLWQKIDKPRQLTSGCETAKEYFENIELRLQKALTNVQRSMRSKYLQLCVKKRSINAQLPAEGISELLKFFTRAPQLEQCPMCYKYCPRVRKDRHSHCFSSQGALYYRYVSFGEKCYCCPLCLGITETATELAKHMADFHHPLDLKFFGYHQHILKRTSQQNFETLTKQITSGQKKSLPQHNYQGQIQKLYKELGTHLASEQPFLSMLHVYTEHILTFSRPIDVDHFVYISGNKISILYSTKIFDSCIYGGLSFDQMIQAQLKLGYSEGSGFYKVTRVEQTVDTLAFVGEFAIPKICPQLYRLKSWLDDNINTVAEVFISMIEELEYLQERSLFVLQGMDLNCWYYDITMKRAYFFAPHWFQTNLNKATQVGHWAVQSAQSKINYRVNGVSGNYGQILLALYVYLTEFAKGQSRAHQVGVDKYNRVKTVIYRDLQESFKTLICPNQSKLFFSPLKKMIAEKPKSPDFYKNAIRFVCRMFNKDQVPTQLQQKFTSTEAKGKKREMKSEMKSKN